MSLRLIYIGLKIQPLGLAPTVGLEPSGPMGLVATGPTGLAPTTELVPTGPIVI